MPNPDDPDVTETVPRRATVIIWLTITLLLLVGVISFLTYRSLTVREPRGAIVVTATSDWNDADASLTSTSGGAKHQTKLDSGGRYRATFFVQPGDYTLRIFKNGKLEMERSIQVAKDKPETIVLPTTMPATAPAS